MRPLTYSRAADVEDALALAAHPASAFLAGGTTEVDLIRAGISRSEHLVDINDLPLGGVGTKPWRARRAEAVLVGGRADPTAFRRAAAAELESAVVRRHNAFKVELARRAIVRGLTHSLSGRQS